MGALQVDDDRLIFAALGLVDGGGVGQIQHFKVASVILGNSAIAEINGQHAVGHGNLSLEYGEDFQFYDSCDMSASAQQIETLYLQETARYGVDNVALLTPYRLDSRREHRPALFRICTLDGNA